MADGGGSREQGGGWTLCMVLGRDSVPRNLSLSLSVIPICGIPVFPSCRCDVPVREQASRLSTHQPRDVALQL